MKEYSEPTKKVIFMTIFGLTIMLVTLFISKSCESAKETEKQPKDSVKYDVIMMSYEEFQKYNEPEVTSKTEITTNSETTIEIIEE